MALSDSTLFYMVIGLSFISLLLLFWNIRNERRIRKLFVGKDAKSLEDSFLNMTKDLKHLREFTEQMQTYLTTVEKRLKKSVQGVETIRFNPFKGTGSGGNQSFSTAFINERGDGVVLTSLYARERISMFAKPVKNFSSEFELSQEEHESIERCKHNVTTV